MLIPALLNDFLVSVHRDKITKIKDLANFSINFIEENIIFINEEIYKDFHVDSIKSNFISNYLNDLENFKLFILTNAKSLQDVHDIVHDELYYIYKNVQLDYVKFYDLDVELIAGKNCCDACKFLNNCHDYSYLFSEDSCESYLRLKPVLTNFVNIIHCNSNLYRVPVKHRRELESFLSYISYKHIPIEKKNIYYFISPEEYNLKDDIIYVQESDKIYLRFRHRTFKADLLRVILSVKESEKSRKLFYDLLSSKNSNISDEFINFLAKQNSFDFLKESCIAYYLMPDTLKEVNLETYNFIDMFLN
jgi:hypothetical protein